MLAISSPTTSIVVLAPTGYAARSAWPDVLLPVGISFFTFQSMSYTIDVYRGKLRPERNIVHFAAFVSLFPQLVAGPIERARNLLPQLKSPRPIGACDLRAALSLFLVGLFKKVACADYLALYVDPIYDSPGHFEAPALLLATFAFGWQIYFDFSGYTDMARGIARLMGFELMVNFNNPYTATGLGDFWGRWHISLSTWFRDYVYIPLGGNRHGTWALHRNIILTMVLSGLWHGAAWGFIAWGAVHGVALIATRGLEQSRAYRQGVPRLVKQLGVFTFVTFAWIFFRARDWEKIIQVVGGIVDLEWSNPGFPWPLLGVIFAVWTYQLLYSAGGRAAGWLECRVLRCGIVLGMIAWLLLIGPAGTSQFIYFQF